MNTTNNIYETHDKFALYLKENKANECKDVIKSYDNIVNLHAILGGACTLEIIAIALGNMKTISENIILSLLSILFITIFVGGLTSRFIVGKKYYKYIKDNNIEIIEDKLR